MKQITYAVVALLLHIKRDANVGVGVGIGTQSSTIIIAPTMQVDGIVVAGAVVARKRRTPPCTRFQGGQVA